MAYDKADCYTVMKHFSAKLLAQWTMQYLSLQAKAVYPATNLDSKVHVLLWTEVTARTNIVHNYIMCKGTHICQISRFRARRKPRSLSAGVLYNQQWVSCVVGAIANCTHPLLWKEAIADSLSIESYNCMPPYIVYCVLVPYISVINQW